MSTVEKFLSQAEEQEIVSAILEAERLTSGEIRVHIEAHSELTAVDRAKQVFQTLKMGNTKHENGVLIYLAVNDKKFAICGDKGIDKVVPEHFWESTRDAIQTQFRQKKFKQGIIDGILQAAAALQEHFPWQRDDTNELPNEVSKG